jgi:hypothetical protein
VFSSFFLHDDVSKKKYEICRLSNVQNELACTASAMQEYPQSTYHKPLNEQTVIQAFSARFDLKKLLVCESFIFV